MTAEPLHIVGLQVENVKRIRAVSIHPEGDIVVLSGRNAQGKTSVLDAIWLALGGGAAKRAVEASETIRAGEEFARVQVDLGTLVVTREWERRDGGPETTRLRVEAEGRTLASPQSVLDALMEHAGFDPLAFTRLSPAQQANALTAIVDLPFGIDEFDAETKQIFDERTSVNRDVERLKSVADALPRYPNAPNEKVDIGAQMTAYRAIEDQITAASHAEQGILAAEANLAQLDSRIASLKAELETAIADRDSTAEILQERRQHAAANDLDGLRAQADAALAAAESAGQVNEQVDANERHRLAVDALVQVQTMSAELTAQIEKRRQDRRDALAAVAFPVPGLGFDESGLVTYRDLPFTQASAAEQVEISTAIAMAGDPRLRVITIRDASLLDSEHLAIIERMAAERDFQVWLEKVDESGTVGIVIENGEVA